MMQRLDKKLAGKKRKLVNFNIFNIIHNNHLIYYLIANYESK